MSPSEDPTAGPGSPPPGAGHETAGEMAAAGSAGLSPLARAGRVFANPFQAWVGLPRQVQWFYPMVVMLAVSAGLLAATFQRVMLPTMVEAWSEAVERGQMSQAQLDKMTDFFTVNPAGLSIIVGQQVVAIVLFTLLVALVVWFGAGFVLGTRFSYRLSLEVTCWAGLVRLPETLLTFAIGWSQESLKGIHLGLGALLPPEETTTKLHGALAVLLDAVGPFNLWYLFVAIVGCSALSGAPRKSVAWVMSALYLGLTVLFAAVALIFGPGA
jgi:hypothetical protein